MRQLLTRRGYLVTGEAGSVAEALEFIRAVIPDAVLLDIRLPDGDGFQLTARLAEEVPSLPVLLTSASYEDHFCAYAESVGARGFVPKSELARVDLGRFWPLRPEI